MIIAELQPGHIVKFDYTNYRGEKSYREVVFRSLEYGTTPYHPREQWFMRAFDLEKRADRTFALDDIEPRSISRF